jgi:hypothetical protein
MVSTGRPGRDWTCRGSSCESVMVPNGTVFLTCRLQCAIILFITGLTLGASYGWGRATFLAPFLIAIVLFPLFFWRESRIPYDNALIPSALWRLPNFLVLVLLSLLTLGWWSVMFLPFIETFHDVHGETYLLSALRTLPIGVSAGFISVVLVYVNRAARSSKGPFTDPQAISFDHC